MKLMLKFALLAAAAHAQPRNQAIQANIAPAGDMTEFSCRCAGPYLLSVRYALPKLGPQEIHLSVDAGASVMVPIPAEAVSSATAQETQQEPRHLPVR